MDELKTSALMSDYNYTIVSDSDSTIFCKQNCIAVTGPVKENFSPYYPAPRDYMEDFSFISNGSDIEFYIGDMKILTLAEEELRLILQHISSRKEYS